MIYKIEQNGQNPPNKVAGPKMGTIKKKYLPSHWTYKAKIWMPDNYSGDLLARKVFRQILNFG